MKVFSEESQRKAIQSAEVLVGRLDPIYRYLLSVVDVFSLGTYDPRSIVEFSGSDPVLFAKRYFFKNVVKCAIASHLFNSEFREVRRVIDLGTGPGTFLFSFAASLKNHEFVGIDRSRNALSLASKLFSVARMQPPLMVQASLPSGVVSGGRFFTASYLLTEFAEYDLMEFIAFAIRRTDAQFLIVDYPHVISEIAAHIEGVRPCAVQSISLNLPESLSEKVGDDHISFGALYAPISSSPYRGLPR
ncbi:methyltransferase domain-containing protein [Caulobacter sp. NIBR2454]|uniref:methyltransferase domain-containing protein n=1 Tax=Caulobacter sp. NIBR2454 TaxID=3015996 RepID=UPI0022B6A01C|nr:class I SAM-dependent methyltransferase [Caulobacter sp. NIBR2454]